MEPIKTIAGAVSHLDRSNVDTDQIMPKQFLFGIDKSGLARGLLYDLRYDDRGQPRETFVLNRPEYRDARILIAGSNFGCGSSREHAVWGLQQAGIEAVIAPSYGEIFYFNAGNNRLLLVTLAPEIVDALVAEHAHADSRQLSIDVENEVVVTASGERHSFSIPPRQKRMFMDGLDMVQMTLQQSDQIDAFEQRHWAANPWARIDLPAQQRSMS